EAIPDVDEQYEALQAADEANGVAWLPPAPFNNTYAIAMTEERADELGISTISEMAELVREEG
ncbi:MAG TPA: glycine betaine ABC transporter substrate-binding protein, partial [Acidimicrobiales bacterium]|nr:glycine betaine ABC transporter substrate-binding protein [Acidimicrobiales bacterium]